MFRYSELGELAPRDVVSRAIIFEISEGRGFIHEESGMGYVGLDVRHIPEEKLKERLTLLMHLAKTYAGVDPLTELIPVGPAVHYTMGGYTRRYLRQSVDAGWAMG
jgi:succinate dehydrogenase / fumarate reductase flavoprotein subunit